MRRAPIVLAGTAAGLAGVLAYTTSSPSSSSVKGLPSTAQTTPTTTSSTSTASARSAAGATSSQTAAAHPQAPAATRTATGEAVSDPYGDLQLKVVKHGARITSISVVRLDDRDARSASIDEIAIPQLTQEAMTAQSARIDTVSGASFTSSAYAQSLQSALDRL